MANMIKKSAMKDIGHLDMHYKRGVQPGHYGNPDIDQSRLHEDLTNFAPTRYQKDSDGNYILDENGQKIELKMTDYIKETIDRVMEGRTLRKDAVKMVCWVVDAPKNMPEEMKPRYFQEVYSFLTSRYGEKSGLGEDIVLSCFWHRSETTDHVHFAFQPILDRDGVKTFCAKEVVGRNDLKTFHNDLEQHMIDLGICQKGDILNGNTIRDSNGRALSVKELKMGKAERLRQREEIQTHNSRWDKNTTTNDHDRSHGRW